MKLKKSAYRTLERVSPATVTSKKVLDLAVKRLAVELDSHALSTPSGRDEVKDILRGRLRVQETFISHREMQTALSILAKKLNRRLAEEGKIHDLRKISIKGN